MCAPTEPQEVWVVTEDYNEQLLGVFSSEQKAQAFISKSDNKNINGYPERFYLDRE